MVREAVWHLFIQDHARARGLPVPPKAALAGGRASPYEPHDRRLQRALWFPGP